MKKLIDIANQLDGARLLKEANLVDRALRAMKNNEQEQLAQADSLAIEHMKEALKSKDIPKFLAQQMEQWIKSKSKN